MVFSSIIFLFRFLPITLFVYYTAPQKFKNAVLVICSLFFYSWGEVKYFPIMIASILVDYICLLYTSHRRSFFAARMQQQQISVRGNSSFSSPTNDGVFRGTGNCVKSRKGKPRVSCFR